MVVWCVLALCVADVDAPYLAVLTLLGWTFVQLRPVC